MKVTDVIFALVSGRIIGFLLQDFLKEWGIGPGLYVQLILWVAFPFFSLFCLWIAYLIGKKFLFVFQMAKFLLVGAVATVIDLKVFEFFHWTFTILIANGILLSKSISFLVATTLKYWGNKYWAFGIAEKATAFNGVPQNAVKNIKKEITQFFFVTIVGLAIDLSAFYYFVKIAGPQFGVSEFFWVKLSVIFAGLIAAAWNFSGYKFWVFKK